MIILHPFKFKQFPIEWEWLLYEPGPKVLAEALRHYGIMEVRGKGSFPDFSKWAKELGVQSVMTDDDVPWCGLFVGICVKRAEFEVVQHPYRAKSWLSFGNAVLTPMLGDVLVFERKGGGHVGFYVGETLDTYAVLGGNQSNSVNITFIAKDRLVSAQRCNWKIMQPPNVRQVWVTASGELSTNEA